MLTHIAPGRAPTDPVGAGSLGERPPVRRTRPRVSQPGYGAMTMPEMRSPSTANRIGLVPVNPSPVTATVTT